MLYCLCAYDSVINICVGGFVFKRYLHFKDMVRKTELESKIDLGHFTMYIHTHTHMGTHGGGQDRELDPPSESVYIFLNFINITVILQHK